MATHRRPREYRLKRIHRSTLYRWISPGVRGIRLETLKLGRTTVTSLEAVQSFAEQLAAQENSGAVASVRSRVHLARVNHELDRHGF